MKMFRFFLTAIVLTVLVCGAPKIVKAETIVLQNGIMFDSDFYVTLYPDVKAAYGTTTSKLLNHYLTYGVKEGRLPSMFLPVAEYPSVAVTPTMVAMPTIVPINQLTNKVSLKKKCTDIEFQAAYNAAAAIATPLLGKTRAEQLQGIQGVLRAMVDNGQVVYSTSIPHYNDPYGYFCLGVSSCAGCARATGLCLNMLEIPYEHVNENQWSHQWCRVNVDGTYWICDPYGLYVGPEPAPYVHPYVY